MKRTIASVLIAIMSILCIGGGYSESDALNGGIEAEEIILDQLPEPEQESEEDMATGDKLVNLDDLKVAYEKQQEDTNSLKSAIHNVYGSLNEAEECTDEIRLNNLFAGTQYLDEYTENSVTVDDYGYSGIKAYGSIAYHGNVSLSKPAISIKSGKKYTFYVKSKNKVSYPANLSFALKNSSQTVNLYFIARDIPNVITANADYDNLFVGLYSATSESQVSISIDDVFYIYVVEGEYTKADFYKKDALLTRVSTLESNMSEAQGDITDLEKDVGLIKPHISQLALIADDVRKNNLFEGTQYDDSFVQSGVTVSKEEYSGLSLDGSLAYHAVVELSRAYINLESGKKYTFYVKPKSETVYPANLSFLLYSVSSQSAIPNSYYFVRTGVPVTFTADANYSNVYVRLYSATSEDTSTIALDDVFYIYVIEGEYSKKYIDIAGYIYDQINATNASVASCETNIENNFDYLDTFKSLSDEIRQKNMFEGTQYPGTYSVSQDVTATKKYYSGIMLNGTFPVGVLAISQALMTIESGKTYTMCIMTDIDSPNLGFRLVGKKPGAELYSPVYQTNGNMVYTREKSSAFVFTPDSDYSNCHFAGYYSQDETIELTNNIYYFFLVEGIYENADFVPITSLNFEEYKTTQVTPSLTVGLPVFRLYGNTSAMSKDNAVKLLWEFDGDSGTADVKWQGSSSIAYSKKNYSLKLDHAIDVKWGDQKKYVFKGNYIDRTNALNICSANLWSQIVANRGTNPAIGVAANNGAMDGFPIIVALNDSFFGIYTFNTPKDKWTFGMGSGNAEYIVTAEDHSTATQFKGTSDLEGEDFELEYAPEGVSTDTVKTALNTMLSTVANATGYHGEDWEAEVNPLLDVGTAIDYMIFSALTTNQDGVDKNFILTTYDGTKWWMNAYDLDTVFGNHWSGGSYYAVDEAGTMLSRLASTSRIFHLIYYYATAKLIARYRVLRGGILSEKNVHTLFYNFCVKIPQSIINADDEKWPLLPGTFTNTLARVTDYYRLRCEVIDAEIDALEESLNNGTLLS